MDIILLGSRLQYKNPITGLPTRNVEEHFYARRVIASINGVERQFRFTKDQLPLITEEEDMIVAIQTQLDSE